MLFIHHSWHMWQQCVLLPHLPPLIHKISLLLKTVILLILGPLISRPFECERVYLPLSKVANTRFPIQGDEVMISISLVNSVFICLQM